MHFSTIIQFRLWQVFWWFLSKLCDPLQIISLYFSLPLFSLLYEVLQLYHTLITLEIQFIWILFSNIYLMLKKNQFFLVIHASLNPTLKLYLRNFVELNAFCAENTINIFVNLLWNDVSAGCIAYIKCWMQINAIFDKISCNLQIVRKMSFCLNFSNIS